MAKTVKVQLKSGEFLELPEREAIELYRSGDVQLLGDDPISFEDSSGKLVSVRAQDVGDAMDRGYTYDVTGRALWERKKEVIEERSRGIVRPGSTGLDEHDPLSKGLALGKGVVESVPLVGGYLSELTGYSDAISSEARGQHEYYNMAGGFLGTAATMAAGGAVLKGMASLASAGKLGQAGLLGTDMVKGAQLAYNTSRYGRFAAANPVTAKVAYGAAFDFAWDAGVQYNQLYMRDQPALSAEGLLSMGEAGIFGAVFGAPFSLIGRGKTRARAKAKADKLEAEELAWAKDMSSEYQAGVEAGGAELRRQMAEEASALTGLRDVDSAMPGMPVSIKQRVDLPFNKASTSTMIDRLDQTADLLADFADVNYGKTTAADAVIAAKNKFYQKRLSGTLTPSDMAEYSKIIREVSEAVDPSGSLFSYDSLMGNNIVDSLSYKHIAGTSVDMETAKLIASDPKYASMAQDELEAHARHRILKRRAAENRGKISRGVDHLQRKATDFAYTTNIASRLPRRKQSELVGSKYRYRAPLKDNVSVARIPADINGTTSSYLQIDGIPGSVQARKILDIMGGLDRDLARIKKHPDVYPFHQFPETIPEGHWLWDKARELNPKNLADGLEKYYHDLTRRYKKRRDFESALHTRISALAASRYIPELKSNTNLSDLDREVLEIINKTDREILDGIDSFDIDRPMADFESRGLSSIDDMTGDLDRLDPDSDAMIREAFESGRDSYKKSAKPPPPPDWKPAEEAKLLKRLRDNGKARMNKAIDLEANNKKIGMGPGKNAQKLREESRMLMKVYGRLRKETRVNEESMNMFRAYDPEHYEYLREIVSSLTKTDKETDKVLAAMGIFRKISDMDFSQIFGGNTIAGNIFRGVVSTVGRVTGFNVPLLKRLGPLAQLKGGDWGKEIALSLVSEGPQTIVGKFLDKVKKGVDAAWNNAPMNKAIKPAARVYFRPGEENREKIKEHYNNLRGRVAPVKSEKDGPDGLYEDIKSAAEDPSMMREEIQNKLGALYEMDSRVAMIMEESMVNRVKYLASLLPQTAPQASTGNVMQMPVDVKAEARFNMAMNTAINPQSVFEDMENGTAVPAQFIDLKNMLPNLWQKAAEAMTEAMEGKDIGWKQSYYYWMMTGQPTDPIIAQTAAFQKAYTNAANEQQQAAAQQRSLKLRADLQNTVTQADRAATDLRRV